MKNHVKIGIIGVGNIGSAHAATIYGGKIENMRLTALCDIDDSRRDILKTLYPDIPMFKSAEELIESGLCDAVLIATPHYAHPPIAEKAFSGELHVLSEKPAGVTCKAVRKMINAAEKSGKLFSVMFNQRTNKLFGTAKEIVSSGALGEMKRANWIITNWYRKECYYRSNSWRATWSSEGGGVLINQAPHNLDLLTWICGMPESIFAKCDEGKYHNITVEDDATILARYKNGATAAFITSTGEYPGTNRFEISGTKGKIVIENGVLTHTNLEIDESYFRKTEESAKNKLSTVQIADERYDGHINILGNFARAILFGEKLVSPGQEAINELALSNAAYLSSWTGREISLPLDDELFEEILFTKAKAENTTARKDERENLQFGYKERWNTKW